MLGGKLKKSLFVNTTEFLVDLGFAFSQSLSNFI